MDGTQDDTVDNAVMRATGEELRRARDRIGWTRAELVARLPSEIHVQTLAAYERGVRQCTLGRFVEICHTMGVAAPDILGWALQHAQIDLQTIGFQVDLHAVLNDTRAQLGPLREWAKKRLDQDPGGSGIARLDWAVVQEMATWFDIDRSEFVEYLIMFTPRPVPKRR